MKSILTFSLFVLLSSCLEEKSKEDEVFFFKGKSVKRFNVPDPSAFLSNTSSITLTVGASSEVTLTIIENKVFFIIRLKKQYGVGNFPYKIGISPQSYCFDKYGNILFDFRNANFSQMSPSLARGTLPYVSAKILPKVYGAQIVLTLSST